jgi:hypothetical protein
MGEYETRQGGIAGDPVEHGVHVVGLWPEGSRFQCLLVMAGTYLPTYLPAWRNYNRRKEVRSAGILTEKGSRARQVRLPIRGVSSTVWPDETQGHESLGADGCSRLYFMMMMGPWVGKRSAVEKR